MKSLLFLTALSVFSLITFRLEAQPKNTGGNSGKATGSKQKNPASQTLYIDVHHLGKVTSKDVAAAHQKDLGVQHKYGVDFIKYWVDESKGDVYCLSTSPDPQAIRKAHGEAHGLIPDEIFQVTEGLEARPGKQKNYFLDVHEFGPEKVSAKDVAAAHQKDLATEHKYGVNFINYWVDEKNGTVMCLSQAPDSNAVINTHREAHGLLPVSVVKVTPGQ